MTNDNDKTEGTPKVLIIVPNYWGKGTTITEAWKQVKRSSYGNLRKLRQGPWCIYFGHDTDDVPLCVDSFGNICHHSDHPVHEIESHIPAASKRG